MRAMLSTVFGATFAFAPAALAAVTVVDPHGGPGGALLQAAIDGSASGDVILVRAGNYSTVNTITVTGKGVTIVNDAGSAAWLPAIAVNGVPAGAALVLRGFTVLGLGVPAQPAVFAQNCAGTLWIEECDIHGAAGSPTGGPSPGLPGMSASNVASLVIERSLISGGSGAEDIFGNNHVSNGDDALVLSASAAAIHGSTLYGGLVPSSSAAGLVPPATAGAGLRSTGSTVLLAGTLARGGSNGNLNGFSGAGVVAPTGAVRVRDCTITAGAVCCGAHKPPNVDAPAGVVSEFFQPTGSLAISTPVVSGANATITYTGVPGGLCMFFIGPAGLTGPPIAMPSLGGAFVLGLPVAGAFVLGNVPPSGTLLLSIPTVPLPAAVPDALGLAMQVVAITPVMTLESASEYLQIRPGL